MANLDKEIEEFDSWFAENWAEAKAEDLAEVLAEVLKIDEQLAALEASDEKAKITK